MKENNNEKYESTLPAGDHTSKGGQAGRPFTTILPDLNHGRPGPRP